MIINSAVHEIDSSEQKCGIQHHIRTSQLKIKFANIYLSVLFPAKN